MAHYVINVGVRAHVCVCVMLPASGCGGHVPVEKHS